MMKTYCVITLSLLFLVALGQGIEKNVQFSQHKYLPAYGFKKLGNTQVFQGNKKKKTYFEGWYFKMVSKDTKAIISIIPGISLSPNGEEQHAFIQVINGTTAKTYYYSFPIEDFTFSKKHFAIKVGNNFFSKDSIVIDVQDIETSIKGKIVMTNQIDYESGRLLNPGIMGWYRYVPYMECYHGVVSLTHHTGGKLNINDLTLNFNGGKGYIEKDWGSSMPASWIWMQSNHFLDSNTSFMLSVANIPWHGKSFNGFIGFLYHNGKQYHFASYRSSELVLNIKDSNTLEMCITNRKETFSIKVKPNTTGLLVAPVNGAMDRRIPESIDAFVHITMVNNKGDTVFIDSSHIVGLEMVGEYKNLEGILN